MNGTLATAVVPLLFWTTIDTGPIAAAAGAFTVIELALAFVMVPTWAPNRTLGPLKPEPAMMTCVPPVTGPDGFAGFSDVIVGVIRPPT